VNRIGTALVCAVLLYLNGVARAAPEPHHDPGPDTETAFSAKVVAVLDGDTVLVVHKAAAQRAGGLMKIRLAGIDAPEKEQDYGAASRSTLKEMVWHRQIRVHTQAVDKYGRTVAQLEMDDLSVNEEMLRRGMAWEYSHYHSDRRYIAIEQEARRSGRGLWAQRDPIPPWIWRKQHAEHKEVSTVLSPGDYTCGSKHHCGQMISCDEAFYYLNVCGVQSLNPQRDGIPCAKLCAGGS
jgi:micrococcal nuclease